MTCPSNMRTSYAVCSLARLVTRTITLCVKPCGFQRYRVPFCVGLVTVAVSLVPPPFPLAGRQGAASLPCRRYNQSPGRITFPGVARRERVSPLPCRWCTRSQGCLTVPVGAASATLQLTRYTQPVLDGSSLHRGTAEETAQVLTSICIGVVHVSLLSACHE
jgi:hypothetical protein